MMGSFGQEKAMELDGVDLMGYTPWECIDLVSFTTGELKIGMALFMHISRMMGREAAGGIKRIPFIGISLLV